MPSTGYSSPRERGEGDGFIISFSLLMFIILIGALFIGTRDTTVTQKECSEKKTVVKIEPVGHQRYTTYFTTFSDGTIKNLGDIYQIGSTVCMDDVTEYN